MTPAPFQSPGRSAVYAPRAMAATSHPLASLAATEALRAGGGAVDAGLAAAFVLNLAEPMMTGLGGDMFALYAPPGAGPEAVEALNGSGPAPAAIDPQAVAARAPAGEIDPLSVDAVTIPGAVGGLLALHRRHGRLDLERLLAPAIAWAEDGAPIAPRTAWDWGRRAARLRGAARGFYLKSDGAPYAVGDVFRAPQEAETLRAIAARGAAGFYDGALAEDMAASLRALGGAHRLEDFQALGADAETGALWSAPARGRYRGAELLTAPPNSQGVFASLILALLERFDLAALDPNGAARRHLEAEAVKLAYDARARLLADPAHGPLAPEAILAAAPALSALIDPARAQPRDALAAAADPIWAAAGAPAPPRGEGGHGGTVYLAVVDAEGGALSLITSIFHGFGSGLAATGCGVLFQSRGAGFSLDPRSPNRIAPGKRPAHTLIPAMLFQDGRLRAIFGVMGGQYQAAGVAGFVSGLLDFGCDPQAALDLPRSFCERAGDADLLTLEAPIPAAVAGQLADLGHRTARAPAPIGGGQAILVDTDRGVLIGGSDPRKDGCALGF